MIHSIRKVLGRSPGDREFRNKMMPIQAIADKKTKALQLMEKIPKLWAPRNRMKPSP